MKFHINIPLRYVHVKFREARPFFEHFMDSLHKCFNRPSYEPKIFIQRVGKHNCLHVHVIICHYVLLTQREILRV